MTDSADPGPGAASSTRPCPICGKPMQAEHRPFCSRRCADVDLNRWLNGRYALPAAPDPEDELDHDRQGGEDT